MYRWVSHTWNPIKGKCQFQCDYCYVPKVRGAHFFEGMPRLDEEDLKTHLGRGKIIFVGSMCDMWAPLVYTKFISRVLDRCADFPENEYIFQTKDPKRFLIFGFERIKRFMLGTTIETDRYPEGFHTKAPPIWERYEIMKKIQGKRLFVTIEPIMDFSLYRLVRMIEEIHPEFVTIGADSKGYGLIEPTWRKVQELIQEVRKFTEIRQKTNLERLKNEDL